MTRHNRYLELDKHQAQHVQSSMRSPQPTTAHSSQMSRPVQLATQLK